MHTKVVGEEGKNLYIEGGGRLGYALHLKYGCGVMAMTSQKAETTYGRGEGTHMLRMKISLSTLSSLQGIYDSKDYFAGCSCLPRRLT